jgi:hypothetical protein
MARTATATANILSDLYEETFSRDSFEPFRITWLQLRSLAAVPRLKEDFLKEISEALMVQIQMDLILTVLHR